MSSLSSSVGVIVQPQSIAPEVLRRKQVLRSLLRPVGLAADHAVPANSGFNAKSAFALSLPAVCVAAAGRRHCKRQCMKQRVTVKSSEDEDQVAYSDLAEWLRARGAYINDAVGLVAGDQVDSTGRVIDRGCVATKDVRAGELLVEIPVSCCLSAPPGAHDAITTSPDVAAALEDAGISKQDMNLGMAVAVEREQGEASAWWPYLRLLHYKHIFPHFYEAAELDALENPPLKETLECVSKAIAMVASKSGLPDTKLREAVSLVRSRRFGSDVTTCMIPLGDMLNHSFYPSCAWDPPTARRPDSWRLKAKMDLAPGDSLNFLYCEDPNHLLLATSGFIMEENPHNRIMVRPSDLRKALMSVCNKESPEDFAKWREEEFKTQVPDPEQEGVGLSMFLVGRRPGGIQWNPLWLDLVGLAVTESRDAAHWSTQPGGMEKYLEAIATASWSIFPTSLDDDASATDMTAAASENMALAAQLRLGYKEMLRDAVASLKVRLTGSS